MKILNILSIFFYFINCNAFTNNIIKPNLKVVHKLNSSINSLSNNKFKSILKLIRYKSILPTFLLSFSGGWIVNPSFYNLLHSTKFIISIVNTLIIMSSSMIINDIYDINHDKINNPNRPLVTGEIKVNEAIILSFLLLCSAEYMSYYFLPYNLQKIIHISIFYVNIYTPIFKKIPIIKNLSCALLVGFSIIFPALSFNYNIRLLFIAFNLIFFGSLYNELLLDMADYEGDKYNNIYTIPVLFGNKISWIIANFILKFNIIINTILLIYLFNYKIGCVLLFILMPLIFELNTVKKYNYSKNIILNIVNKLNKSLLCMLFYLCILSKYFIKNE